MLRDRDLDCTGNDLPLAIGGLTTPFTTQNRPKAACDFYGTSQPYAQKRHTIKDFETQRVVAGTLGERPTRSRPLVSGFIS